MTYIHQPQQELDQQLEYLWSDFTALDQELDRVDSILNADDNVSYMLPTFPSNDEIIAEIAASNLEANAHDIPTVKRSNRSCDILHTTTTDVSPSQTNDYVHDEADFSSNHDFSKDDEFKEIDNFISSHIIKVKEHRTEDGNNILLNENTGRIAHVSESVCTPTKDPPTKPSQWKYKTA